MFIITTMCGCVCAKFSQVQNYKKSSTIKNSSLIDKMIAIE